MDHAGRPPLIQSLRTAVAAAPADVPLRLHLAQLLLEADRSDEAVTEAAVALQHAPGDAQARALMARAMGAPPLSPPAEHPRPRTGFDWKAAEDQVGDAVPPRFAATPVRADGLDDSADADAWDVEDPGTVRLADVGGMQDVKDRMDAAFLAPLRNPELCKLYGKSLRGGLLLYGPPGCGKTFIARAVAGELGAAFLSVSVNDVLDMWIGNSERNMHEVFETARRQAPCVVFLDELDALGAKRSRTAHSGMRNVVNQLLSELDGIDSAANEGVFVLAATNVPWDVDNALQPARPPGQDDPRPPARRARPGGDPPLPPAGPAHRERRPGQAGQDHRRPVRCGPRPCLRGGGRAGTAGLGAHRHRTDDRHEGPAGRRERDGAVRRTVVRLRAQRGDVRQRGRYVRRPGDVPEEEAQAVTTTLHPAVERADLLIDLKRFEEARELLAGRLAEDPEDIRAWVELARSHVEDKEDGAKALEATEQALALNAQDVGALLMHARALRVGAASRRPRACCAR